MNALTIHFAALLANAAAPASPPSDTATTSPPPEPAARSASQMLQEGFSMKSRDERHVLKIGFLGQVRATVRGSDGQPTSGVDVHLARPVLEGHLFDGRVVARLMPEFAGGPPRVLDASVVVTPHESIEIEAGQFRPWISRGFRTGLPVQALADRGAVVGAFRIDRDVGVSVGGHPLDGRLEYYVGVYNGDGPGSTQVQQSPLVTARIVVAPLGRVGYDQAPYLRDSGKPGIAIGLGAYTRRYRTDAAHAPTATAKAPIDTVDELGASADLAGHWGRFAVTSEGFWRRRVTSLATSDSWGAYGQGSVLLVPHRLDIAARVGSIVVDHEVSLPIEGGLGVYLADHHAKIQAVYGYTHPVHHHGTPVHTGLLQAQLSF